jgi:DNA replication protein DnaC
MNLELQTIGEKIGKTYPLLQSVQNQPTGENSESYEMELTEEEILACLAKAKQIKNQKAVTADYWAKIEESRKPVKLSTVDFLHWIRTTYDVKIDEFNRKEISLLAQYFNDDADFEKDGRNLNKGLLLMGNIGCGKTFLMKCFCNSPKQNYSVVRANEITEQFKVFQSLRKNDEQDLFLKFNRTTRSKTGIFNRQDGYGWCFDDLGTEGQVISFGQNYNVFQEIFERAYHEGFMPNIHVTTNLTGDEIEQKYGKRIRSRMREMFNVIDFNENAPDRRA